MGWGQLPENAQRPTAEEELRDVLGDNIDPALEQVAAFAEGEWILDTHALDALVQVLAGNLAAAGFSR